MGGIAFYFKVHELVEGETLSGVFITAVESYYKIAISPFSVETEKLYINITFYFFSLSGCPLATVQKQIARQCKSPPATPPHKKSELIIH